MDAAVVCRQLGYSGVVAAPRGPAFGGGSGPFVVNALSCSGNEVNITYCGYNYYYSYQQCSTNSAGVICSSTGRCMHVN